MNRRKFIKNTTILSSVLIGGASIYAVKVEPFWLEIERHDMSIKSLPRHLEGKTLMQISDIHIGNQFDYQFVIDSFVKVRALKPDFVVYTGDYITYEDGEQFNQLSSVMEHAVKGSLGTLAILGNHDYGFNWSDLKVASRVSSILRKKGISVLRNEIRDHSGLRFIGLDDYWAPNFNPRLAMQDYDPSRATIVLCHNPDVCDLDVWENYTGWILAGHTHGGQVKAPFFNPPKLPVKNKSYTSGFFQLSDNRKLYINRALGHLLQVRFNVRPEITLFTLRNA